MIHVADEGTGTIERRLEALKRERRPHFETSSSSVSAADSSSPPLTAAEASIAGAVSSRRRNRGARPGDILGSTGAGGMQARRRALESPWGPLQFQLCLIAGTLLGVIVGAEIARPR
jgi:hypothetical protein